ncbi:hypothetical protein CGMCC3_g10633 [Colletotrichum fructicola]|nr:uncharacterized protein CGMCC3_g10633 [Colletotrichum fructicola]KAE9573247.1 hypothetical protein CGMCC3_g10633 [Colletotrichum fructicola]
MQFIPAYCFSHVAFKIIITIIAMTPFSGSFTELLNISTNIDH